MRRSFPLPPVTLLVCVAALPALLAALLTVSPASADEFARPVDMEKATFVLVSGETFTMVPFEVDQRFRTVELELPDGSRHVSFADIASVAVEQQDVTEAVLGRPARPVADAAPEKAAAEEVPADPGGTPGVPVSAPATAATPAEPAAPVIPAEPATPDESAPAIPAEDETEDQESPWISKDSPTYRQASDPLWRLGLRGAANFSIPTGDYYDGLKAGLGYEGDLIIPIKRDWSLRLSVSRSGMKPGSDLTLVSYDAGITIANQDWDMKAWRYTIAAQFQKPLSDRKGDLSLLYGYTGLGAISQELTVGADLVEVASGDRAHFEDSYSESKFIQTLGGGVMKMVAPTVALDFSVEMDIVYIGTVDNDSYSYFGNTQTSLLFDFKVGVVKIFK